MKLTLILVSCLFLYSMALDMSTMLPMPLTSKNRALEVQLSQLEEKIECVTKKTLDGFCLNESPEEIHQNTLEKNSEEEQEEEEVNSLEVDIQRLKKKSTQRLYTIRGVIRETQKQIMKINKKNLKIISKQKAKVSKLISKTKKALNNHKVAHYAWLKAYKLSKKSDQDLLKSKKKLSNLEKVAIKTHKKLKDLIKKTKIAKGKLQGAIEYKKIQNANILKDMKMVKNIQHHVKRLMKKRN